MKNCIKWLLFVVIFCFNNNEAYTTDYNYRNFTIEDGLPCSQIYNIVQDVNGFLWFATDSGICRYDGYEFITFDIDDGLPENDVLHLYLQNNGEIWGVTSSGALFYFSPIDYVIKKYPFNSIIRNEVGKCIISSLYIDKDIVYIGFFKKLGFIKINSKGEYCYYNDKISTGETFNIINAVSSDENGTSSLVFSFNDINELECMGLSLDMTISKDVPSNYNRSTRLGSKTVFSSLNQFEFQTADTSWTKELKSVIYCIGFTEDNNIYVGFENKGLKIYSSNGKQIDSFLEGKSVTDLFIDHSNGMWLTTLYSGIFYVQNPSFQQIKLLKNRNHGMINITKTKSNHIYIGYNNGALVKYIDELTNFVISNPYGTQKCNIGYNPYFDRVLIQTFGGFYFDADTTSSIGSQFLHGMGLSSGRLNIADDYSQKEFFITAKNGFAHFDKDLKYRMHATDFPISDAIRAPEGLYLGSEEGLYHFDTLGEMNLLYNDNSLFSTNIVDINKNGHYYFAATKGQGLIVFNKDTTFTIRETNGLYNNSINKLYTQNDSTLWICSNSGLNRLRIKDNGHYVVTGINQGNGLLYDEVRDVKIVGDDVWVVTGWGLNVFPVANIDQQHKEHFYLSITSLLINDSIVGSTSHNILTHDQHDLNILFHAISFKNQKIKYRYKLHGLEKSWKYTTSRNVRFSGLDPGHYEFILQVASSNSNLYLEEQRLNIVIIPPFYARTWFKLMLGTILLFIIYMFFKVRILIYNRDITREILRYFLKLIRKEQKFIVIREQGQNVKIFTSYILYIKSSNNNIEIYTSRGCHITRLKISSFLDLLPDPLEFLQVHRSYIIRLDKIQQYDRKNVQIGDEKIPISNKYYAKYVKILF